MANLTGLDTWSVISGAIGVLTVIPLICAYVWSQHPETKFARLDSTLKETENLLRSVVEEGLLDPERHVAHFELQLKKFRGKTEQFRDETYMASNEWRKLLAAWYNGLSKRISLVCKRVKAVRANICETSANARMELMQQSRDEVPPSRRAWGMNFANFCKRILLFVYPGAQAPAEMTDVPGPASTIIDTVNSENVSSPERNATTTASASETPCACSPSQCLPCHKLPTQRPAPEFIRPSRRVSRTASQTQQHHVLAHALRRVDRKLTAQGVPNTLLTQLVQATHRHWSPASSKAYHPRRSRKQHRPMPRPEHVTPLQRASEPGINVDSDADSSGEETMCEV